MMTGVESNSVRRNLDRGWLYQPPSTAFHFFAVSALVTCYRDQNSFNKYTVSEQVVGVTYYLNSWFDYNDVYKSIVLLLKISPMGQLTVYKDLRPYS